MLDVLDGQSERLYLGQSLTPVGHRGTQMREYLITALHSGALSLACRTFIKLPLLIISAPRGPGPGALAVHALQEDVVAGQLVGSGRPRPPLWVAAAAGAAVAAVRAGCSLQFGGLQLVDLGYRAVLTQHVQHLLGGHEAGLVHGGVEAVQAGQAVRLGEAELVLVVEQLRHGEGGAGPAAGPTLPTPPVELSNVSLVHLQQ